MSEAAVAEENTTMLKPQKMEATAKYLQMLMDKSILRDNVMERYLPAVRSVFDNLELRQIHDQTVKEVVEDFKKEIMTNL